jgi:hypothetical protein
MDALARIINIGDGDTISLMRIFRYFSSDRKSQVMNNNLTSIGSSPHTGSNMYIYIYKWMHKYVYTYTVHIVYTAYTVYIYMSTYTYSYIHIHRLGSSNCDTTRWGRWVTVFA